MKERLSRDVVVGAALSLADAEGLDAVTIRRLATDLGVTPMALYWHFKDKERLLDGVAELVLSQIELGEDASLAWDEQVRSALEALLEVLREHRSVTEVVKSRVMLSPAGLELTEHVLRALRGAGFTPEQSCQIAVQALSTVVGLVAAEPGMPLAEETEEDHDQRLRTKKAQLMALPPRLYPTVVEAADPLTECASPDGYFTTGIDLLVHGMRGLLAAGPHASS